MGRIRQIIRAYQVTHEYDKALPYLLIGAFLLPIAIGIVIGLIVGLRLQRDLRRRHGRRSWPPMFMLVRRAKAATYKRYAGTGRLGRGGPAVCCPRSGSPRRSSRPTATATSCTARSAPAGWCSSARASPVGCGNCWPARCKKHERVAYGVTVTTVVMGDKEGQVPLNKLADHIRKLPKTLQPHQITDIKQRLRALDAVRPPVPVPKGPMPTNPRQVKGARQAMRGR